MPILDLDPYVTPGEHVFWFSVFPENIDSISVSGKNVKLQSLQDGNQILKMIFEFDKDGNKLCPFSCLPKEDMVTFGVINTLRGGYYGLDLKTGEFVLNGMKIGVTIPRTQDDDVVGEYSIGRKTHLRISGNNYPYSSTLFFKKYARARKISQAAIKSFDKDSLLEMHRKSSEIESYTFGYIFRTEYKQYLASLTLDTYDYSPLLGVKTANLDEDILNI